MEGCGQGPLADRFVYSTEGGVQCFMEDFHCWYTSKRAAITAPPSDGAPPACDPAVLEAMVAEPGGRREELGVLAVPAADFADELREFFGTAGGRAHAGLVGFDEEGGGGVVRVAEIRVVTSLFERQPRMVVEPVYEVYEAMLGAEAREAWPSAFAICGRDFIWMVTQQELVKGVFSGFAICFPVAFLVLVLATGNVLVSIFATCSIAFIVAGVLGCCKPV